MKIHITNLYNFNKNDELVKKQHRFAEAGRSLGFFEMGIFGYPVKTDSASELSKRLDGVIASLEAEDVVFVQLPTSNGYKYESLLINKIKAYRGTKVVLILHDTTLSTSVEEHAKYEILYKLADEIIVPTESEVEALKEIGVSDFYLKKLLIDAMATVRETESRKILMNIQSSAEEVHISFGLYDKTGNYSVWVGVVMQSVIETTNAKVCFHILHDDTLSETNKQKLMKVATKGGQRVAFHFLDNTLFREVEKQVGNFTIGTMFRVMLPELLADLPKVIYLDADVLVHRDIKELWDVDISKYDMAAVADDDVAKGLAITVPVKKGEVPAERYFNAGVLVINLERVCAKGNMCQAVVQYLQKNKDSILPDQDALNAIYGKDTLLLNDSWNTFVTPIQDKGEKELEDRIYHYAGGLCILYTGTGADRLYYETITRTPWGEEERKKQLDKAFARITDRVDQLGKILRECTSGEKKRIYYGEETRAMKNMYRLLSLREGDYRIISNPKKSDESILPVKEFSALLEEKKPFVVFVLPQADNGRAVENLEKMGLVNGETFFVIPRVLAPGDGGYA